MVFRKTADVIERVLWWRDANSITIRLQRRKVHKLSHPEGLVE